MTVEDREWLYWECQRCGIVGAWHPDESSETCEGFYRDPRAYPVPWELF